MNRKPFNYIKSNSPDRPDSRNIEYNLRWKAEKLNYFSKRATSSHKSRNINKVLKSFDIVTLSEKDLPELDSKGTSQAFTTYTGYEDPSKSSSRKKNIFKYPKSAASPGWAECFKSGRRLSKTPKVKMFGQKKKDKYRTVKGLANLLLY
mmetsp:Transcript_34190/g.33779  ORF Transcript_34190/g.33779 Transcript_34190/m.33779 type:complete len:149 (+) Transcript_34190:135-581(+)